MDKEILVARVAELEDVDVKVAEGFVKSFITAVKEGIEDDKLVDIYGFAKFEVVDTLERKGRNPKTGETLIIPAGKKVKVSLKKAIKSLAE